MPDTITLSESAVATLRFRVKGWKMPVRDRHLEAFHELVAAGIMEPHGDDFRFTEEAGHDETNCSPRRRSGSSETATSRPMRAICRKPPGTYYGGYRPASASRSWARIDSRSANWREPGS